MNIEEFLKHQEDDIKNQFINNMYECLIATKLDRITRHAKEYHWTLSFVIKTARKKVIVVKKAHSVFPELWVSSKYRNYRQAFIKYIAQFFSVTDSISPSQHVDHIMPISRFRNKYPQYFIRLFLLDKKMNCSFGAGYEKSLNQFESKKEPNGGFHLDGITLLKLLGIKIPKKNSTADEREKWAKETAHLLENKGFGKWIDNYPMLLVGLYDGYRNIPLHKDFTLSYGTMQVRRDYTI